MTREEALRELIDILDEATAYPDAVCYVTSEDEDALNMAIEALKAKTGGDLISRQDVVNEIHKYFVEEIDKTPTETDEDGDEVYTDMPTVNSLLACNKELSKRIKALPSAEANSDDLIIKGAKGIQDGLYNITDGKLFKYKRKGGTVRTYPIVSAEAVEGEWIFNPTDAIDLMFAKPKCSKCGFESSDGGNFCPNCKARMRGEKHE